MGCKDPRELAKRAGLIRIREHHLADEPAEAPSSEGKRLGSGPYHRKSPFGADREGLTIEVDANRAATPSHNLLEFGAAAATHVHHTGRRGEVRKAVVIKDVAGPKGFRWHGRGG